MSTAKRHLTKAVKSDSNAEVIKALLSAGCSTKVKDENVKTSLRYLKKKANLKHSDKYRGNVDALRE